MPSESEEKEEYHLAKGYRRCFGAGEAVICRQVKGMAHGQMTLLEESTRVFPLYHIVRMSFTASIRQRVKRRLPALRPRPGAEGGGPPVK